MLKKITAIGGGSGLSNICRGLKYLPIELAVVVTTSDDGGSTGKIIKNNNIPAMGDLRKVMVSLSDQNTILEELLDYRFQNQIDDHSLGNLMITALHDINKDFKKTINDFSKVLNVKAKIIPTFLEQTTICCELENGQIIEGESNFHKTKSKIKKITYKEDTKPNQEFLDTLENTDFIILSTGSLFTSIIPNLAIKDVYESIKKSKAKIIYICNIMTEDGETDYFTTNDHVKTLEEYLPRKIDLVIVNNKEIEEHHIQKYEKESNSYVCIDDFKSSAKKLLPVAYINKKGHIRHDYVVLGIYLHQYFTS